MNEVYQPRFKDEQYLMHWEDDTVLYKVLAAPKDTNGFYFLVKLSLTGAVLEYLTRGRKDMGDYVPVDRPVYVSTPVKFPEKSFVRHKKTGGVYSIVADPARSMIEATGERAYIYTNGKDVYTRAQTNMEDGRFETHYFHSSDLTAELY